MNRVSLFFFIVAFSCGTKLPDIKNESKNDSLTVDTIVDTAPTETSEGFNQFFEKFKNDSLFQRERIAFPMTALIWEMREDSLKKILINKDDWKFLDFRYEESFAKRQLDPYTQVIKAYGDTVKLEIRGVDNGIYTDFEFTMKSGKWYLVSEKDYSN